MKSTLNIKIHKIDTSSEILYLEIMHFVANSDLVPINRVHMYVYICAYVFMYKYIPKCRLGNVKSNFQTLIV